MDVAPEVSGALTAAHSYLVSILLFVDVAPEAGVWAGSAASNIVSILLFVDVAPEDTWLIDNINRRFCFNPSFRGCGS